MSVGRSRTVGCEFPLKEIHSGNAHDPTNDHSNSVEEGGLDLIDLRRTMTKEGKLFFIGMTMNI